MTLLWFQYYRYIIRLREKCHKPTLNPNRKSGKNPRKHSGVLLITRSNYVPCKIRMYPACISPCIVRIPLDNLELYTASESTENNVPSGTPRPIYSTRNRMY